MKSRIVTTIAFVVPLLMLARPVLAAAATKIVVGSKSLGKSIEYSGVNGQMSYNSQQLKDIGFNSWRIWDDLNDFEWKDDDGKYGYPSIAQLKADKNINSSGLIPWAFWDSSMGNHRAFFDQLKADKVKLYLSMRNICWGCQWLTKPPQSDADWNEWWEHVFAEIYWLNVRNDYQFDFFEIFNEPDNSGQGWGGTEAEYLKFASVTADAINFLYKKYIPHRKPWILGPAVDYPQVPSDSSVPGGKGWVDDLLKLKPAAINAISFHSYLTGSSLTWGVNYAHGLAANHGSPNMPVWISELGTYDQLGNGATQNGNVPFVIRFISSMIEMSKPSAQLTGMNYFIWQDSGDGSGLIDHNGTPRTAYYGLRFANRALNHGKPTFAAPTSQTSLTTLATHDSKKAFFIVTNMNQSQTFNVQADLSALTKFTGTGTLYRYDAKNNDAHSKITVKNGVATFTIPPNGAAQVVVPLT